MTENTLPRIRPKHKAFADEWILCKNGQEAAEKAGYSKKYARVTAYKILQRPEVKLYIESELDKHVMDVQEAKRLIGQTAREAESESVRLRALEKIIDMHGLTKQNVNLMGDITIEVSIDDKDQSTEGGIQ